MAEDQRERLMSRLREEMNSLQLYVDGYMTGDMQPVLERIEKLGQRLKKMDKGEENEMRIGCCRFCGNQRMIDADEDMTQEELNEEATEQCNCGQAAVYARNKRILEAYAQDLFVLLGEDREKLRGVLYAAGALILEGEIGGVNMRLPGDASIKIQYKKSGLATSLVKKHTEETMSVG